MADLTIGDLKVCGTCYWWSGPCLVGDIYRGSDIESSCVCPDVPKRKDGKPFQKYSYLGCDAHCSCDGWWRCYFDD
uniref:Uncharacterized protein n=1 Tax=viral metagenome TaxID=1070528 RepID=A0A6M3KCG5_9ZZZZ